MDVHHCCDACFPIYFKFCPYCGKPFRPGFRLPTEDFIIRRPRKVDSTCRIPVLEPKLIPSLLQAFIENKEIYFVDENSVEVTVDLTRLLNYAFQIKTRSRQQSNQGTTSL